jgi:hypothetical protein
MECPYCGCQGFYVKDLDNEYEMYEFNIVNGNIVFSDEFDESEGPKVDEETHTYCNQCSWHGKFRELKKKGA